MVANTSSSVVSAIARALGHKCAPTPDQEMQVQTVHELGELMRKNNIARRVRRPNRESAEWLIGYRDDGTPNLIHITGNNRLRIESTDKKVELEVWAGAVDDRSHPDGSIVTALRLVPKPDGPPTVIIMMASVGDRLDRLEPLVKIDRELGGVIKEHLMQTGGTRFIDSHLCSQLLPAWELYEQGEQVSPKEFCGALWELRRFNSGPTMPHGIRALQLGIMLTHLIRENPNVEEFEQELNEMAKNRNPRRALLVLAAKETLGYWHAKRWHRDTNGTLVIRAWPPKKRRGKN